MQSLHTIEASRINNQRNLDKAKSHGERNKLGQFATPPQLALDIITQTNKYIASEEKVRFLDPAFGTGAFFSALLQIFPPETIEKATNFEVDPHYGEEARRLWSNSMLKVLIRDFFAIPIPSIKEDFANLIVCNPPYVRHHHLTAVQKEHFSRSIARSVGLRVNGLSGLYCYFLLHAHNWLADNGLGCWLIPGEFMDVKYGTVVKEYLVRKVTLLRIHGFDTAESQFDDALVSSTVVWFRKSPPPDAYSIEFTFGGSLEFPRTLTSVSSSELIKAPKWSAFKMVRPPATNVSVKLSALFKVKRGLATGANEFFILSTDEIQEHELPSRFLMPILPGPRYLKSDIVEADAKGNPLIEKPGFLLSCNIPPREVKREYPSLWNYLESGVHKKINERYLCLHRSPWYAQEIRPPAPFLCTYMGCHNSPKGSPFRFILNRSKATAANVYLFLYPNLAVQRLLEIHPDWIEKIWQGLRNISSDLLVSEGRVYGGGLHKMEPGELANASAECIIEILPELGSLITHSTKVSSSQESFL